MAPRALAQIGCRPVLAALLSVLDEELSADWTSALLACFATLSDIFAASPEALLRAAGDRRVANLLTRVRDAQLHVLRAPLLDRPILSSSETLRAYLHGRLAHQPNECLHVLYLDAANHLLRDEAAATGCASEVTLHPRAILRRALELGATALIVAHNHPSGNPAPSPEDCSATRRLAVAASCLDIRLHDHLIVARAGTISFRAAGLL